MPHVQQFDSFEEAQQAMRDAEERANALVLPEQKTIGYGSYWCQPVPEYGIFIFGHIWTKEQTDKGESRETQRSMADAHARGYRFGMAYSVIEPDGELGSTHIANMWPITEEEFNEAKENNWTPTEALVKRVFAEAQAAKRKARMESSVDAPAKFEKVDDKDA